MNLKEQSFLTKFVLWALPAKMFKRKDDDENEMGSDLIWNVETVCSELRELASESLKAWKFLAFAGMSKSPA